MRASLAIRGFRARPRAPRQESSMASPELELPGIRWALRIIRASRNHTIRDAVDVAFLSCVETISRTMVFQ